MVAEPIAGSPVGDPGIDPALKDREVSFTEPVCKGRDQTGDDTCLLEGAGPVELFAEREDLLLLPGS
jgi:hypothetical protein